MHEMSLCQSMVDIITEQAATGDFDRVTGVRLELGALSCVEPEALRFCFDAVTKGTPAEGATLDIVVVPGSAWCWECDDTVAILALGLPCPACGGYSLQVTGGREMRLTELEVQ